MVDLIKEDSFIVGIKKNLIFNWYALDADYFYQEGIKEWEKEDSSIDSRKILTKELTLEILKSIKQGSSLEVFSPVIFIDCDTKCIYSQYPEPNDFDRYISTGWNYTEDFILNELISDDNKYWIYNNKNLFMM